ncbi:MAG TPA: hypothetical protein VFZ65_18300 [Planctomycetota bacterium]|nr:hypothetical protein [Planctomycetota bacterium]
MNTRLRARKRTAAAAMQWVLLAACAAPPAAVPEAVPAAVPEAGPWPAADALFSSDPHWLGGDAVYSVDLGGERILWLFGDSFVATDDTRDRRHSVMVRNSIAVQQGRDPERATLSFHWQSGGDGRPAPFFGDEDGHGFWPLHGIRLAGGPLFLFQTRVRNTPGEGLGFAIDGWRIVCIDEPDLDPTQWRWREVLLPPMPVACAMGTAVWRDGEQVVALGTNGNGPHRGMLCRLPIEALCRGVATPQWWDGTRWSETPSHEPATVLDDAGPECSLHRVEGGWLHVYSRGFGATTVAVHHCAQVTGPWSEARDVLTPPESRREHAFVYAAKAHPELDAGPGRLAISYACNAFAFGDLFTASGQRELYWPRFWRLAVPGR